MKSLFTFIFICFSFVCAIGNPVFRGLQQVNTYWSAQPDINYASLPARGASTAQEWIQLHLSLVETTLRKRSTTTLSEQQRDNRMRCLAYLHTYWQEARFPKNEKYDYHTPIFIDEYDNFCAVGYLVKASGYEHVSRKISAQSNLAYVHEMDYPELTSWAKEHGFTIDELAWIQPEYGPELKKLTQIGHGVDGDVNKLYTDHQNARIYIGGIFKNAGSDSFANSIVYLTDAGDRYTWHNMGQGVNGHVHAITKFGDQIFIGGNFSKAGNISVDNVAQWDGSTWSRAGCLSGTVKDLIVYQENLFAVGNFTLCNATREANFAIWNGRGWQAIDGLSGNINTAETVGDVLFLGGRFNYEGTPTNAIKWQAEHGFSTFQNAITHEVNDFEIFRDTVYAGCKYIAGSDTSILVHLIDDTWRPYHIAAPFQYPSNPPYIIMPEIHSLFADNDSLIMSGVFSLYEADHLYHRNICKVNYLEGEFNPLVFKSGSVRSFTRYKHEIIIGGNFHAGDLMAGNGNTANKIARITNPEHTSIGTHNKNRTPTELYPNPVQSGAAINIVSENSGKIQVTLYDMQGRTIQITPNVQSFIKLPVLAPGFYLAEIVDSEGIKSTTKLLIE